ncbi:hypothetical protein FACS189461_0760 [Spirochaetia bacterium]|nr:hypothetical protein FACS189461_0760 [Spirochaetia bacterium]
MPFFDSRFPDPMDCYYALFQDAVYEHDGQCVYAFTNGALVRRNRAQVMGAIKEMADHLYDTLAKKEKGFGICKPIIDYPSLISVLTRYSRDVYGFRRITAKIDHLGNVLKEEQRKILENIIAEGADFGFKMPTKQPYIERQTAVLLYWFSVLKPFHLEYEVTAGREPPEAYIQAYFNEYFSYFMVCLALYPLSMSMDIHKDRAVFEEFLNQLHFRNLSRSSLEFFLPYHKSSSNPLN